MKRSISLTRIRKAVKDFKFDDTLITIIDGMVWRQRNHKKPTTDPNVFIEEAIIALGRSLDEAKYNVHEDERTRGRGSFN